MNRRGFLSSILALAAAPAIVRADSLMRIVPVDTAILTYGWTEFPIDAVNRHAAELFKSEFGRYEHTIIIDQMRDPLRVRLLPPDPAGPWERAFKRAMAEYREGA